MKTKTLSIVILLGSLISGVIGAYFFMYYISPELLGPQISPSSGPNQVIKDGKNITITDLESELTDIVLEMGPSVVSVIISKEIDTYRRDPWGFFQEKTGSVERQVGGGSGFFVRKDGTILTNKHVVSDTQAKYTVITSDGDEYSASVIARDKLTDLAILKIDTPDRDFQVLESVDDDTFIKIGQFAIAIGNALGEFQNSVSFGVISGKNRFIIASGGRGMGNEELAGLLQTDAAINPGNSGGPLLNLDGKVIGINTAIAGDGQGLGFSIPLTQKRIDYILKSIDTYGEIKQPFIGISYLPVTDSLIKQYALDVHYGAFIPKNEASVLSGSKAQEAGIEPGDILLEINNTPITQQNTLPSLIQNNIPGDIVYITLLKENGDTKIISLELGEY